MTALKQSGRASIARLPTRFVIIIPAGKLVINVPAAFMVQAI